MPLTKEMKEIRNIFRKEYGKSRGGIIFYAWENKRKKRRKK
jgi:hypothetical protein